MRRDHSTAVSGAGKIAVRFDIRGTIEPAAYLDFVADRARWLDLNGWAEPTGPRSVRLVVTGAEVLVGALEMACILGPGDMVIEDVIAGDALPAPRGALPLNRSRGFPAS